MRAQRRALTHVEDALKANNLPPLTWYDILLELRRSPIGLRAQTLEQKLLLAQYNISRLVERLAKEGYLEKHPDPDDGRSTRLIITAKGQALLAQMWPVYSAAIKAVIEACLSEDERETLCTLLNRTAI